MIGPNGVNNGILNDFFVGKLERRYKLQEKIKKIILLYYSHFPSFLFEKEICQGLYFEGKIPDYKADSKNLTLLILNRTKK